MNLGLLPTLVSTPYWGVKKFSLLQPMLSAIRSIFSQPKWLKSLFLLGQKIGVNNFGEKNPINISFFPAQQKHILKPLRTRGNLTLARGLDPVWTNRSYLTPTWIMQSCVYMEVFVKFWSAEACQPWNRLPVGMLLRLWVLANSCKYLYEEELES